jgi:hypothetical protein
VAQVAYRLLHIPEACEKKPLTSQDDISDQPVRVGVYLRQSLDKEADTPAKARAAVRWQSAQCDETIAYKSRIAESEGKPGWVRADTFEDNSRSAAKARNRDEFGRRLADIRAGRLDVVMAKHVDRLARNLRDLVDLMEACQEHGGMPARSAGRRLGYAVRTSRWSRTRPSP